MTSSAKHPRLEHADDRRGLHSHLSATTHAAGSASAKRGGPPPLLVGLHEALVSRIYGLAATPEEGLRDMARVNRRLVEIAFHHLCPVVGKNSFVTMENSEAQHVVKQLLAARETRRLFYALAGASPGAASCILLQHAMSRACASGFYFHCNDGGGNGGENADDDGAGDASARFDPLLAAPQSAPALFFALPQVVNALIVVDDAHRRRDEDTAAAAAAAARDVLHDHVVDEGCAASMMTYLSLLRECCEAASGSSAGAASERFHILAESIAVFSEWMHHRITRRFGSGFTPKHTLYPTGAPLALAAAWSCARREGAVTDGGGVLGHLVVLANRMRRREPRGISALINSASLFAEDTHEAEAALHRASLQAGAGALASVARLFRAGLLTPRGVAAWIAAHRELALRADLKDVGVAAAHRALARRLALMQWLAVNPAPGRQMGHFSFADIEAIEGEILVLPAIFAAHAKWGDADRLRAYVGNALSQLKSTIAAVLGFNMLVDFTAQALHAVSMHPLLPLRFPTGVSGGGVGGAAGSGIFTFAGGGFAGSVALAPGAEDDVEFGDVGDELSRHDACSFVDDGGGAGGGDDGSIAIGATSQDTDCVAAITASLPRLLGAHPALLRRAHRLLVLMLRFAPAPVMGDTEGAEAKRARVHVSVVNAILDVLSGEQAESVASDGGGEVAMRLLELISVPIVATPMGGICEAGGTTFVGGVDENDEDDVNESGAGGKDSRPRGGTTAGAGGGLEDPLDEGKPLPRLLHWEALDDLCAELLDCVAPPYSSRCAATMLRITEAAAPSMRARRLPRFKAAVLEWATQLHEAGMGSQGDDVWWKRFARKFAGWRPPPIVISL